MKTFFFANQMGNCSNCRYQICPRRYLMKLRSHGEMGDILPLQSVAYEDPEQSVPGQGDVIVLYAENGTELERLIGKRDDFEGLKKILVVGDARGIDTSRYHRLGPRFITGAEQSINELTAVVKRMRKKEH